MKKSKLIVILLCVVMLFSIVACNKTDDNSNNNAGNNSNNADNNSNSNANNNTDSNTNSNANSNDNQSSQGNEGQSNQGGAVRDTLNIAYQQDSGVLIPGQVTGGQYNALQSIYEPLWDMDEDGNMIYVLMESYEELAPDHWRVKLREGVKFSNGVEMTADDVVFSLKYWKTIPVNSVRVQSMDDERTVAYDRYTVDLYMLGGYYYMHDTASTMFMIHCEEGFDEEDLMTHPVGTGPYKLNEYVVNSHLFLERRDDYWGKPPAMKYLNFRCLAEPSQIVNALSTGMIDSAMIQLADADYVSSLPGYNTDARYIGGGVSLSINSGENSFFNRWWDVDKSLDARKAVYHAIDPWVLINLVYEGKGRLMHGVVPDFMLDYLPEYDYMADFYRTGYNLELAQQLADSSGLTGRTIVMVTAGTADGILMAEIVQSMLDKIGVKVEIQNYDGATIFQMIYDPNASWEIMVGAGIAPNRRVADLLLNGVRYSNTLTIPGAFPGNEWYLEHCAEMMHNPDPVGRRAIEKECLQMFTDECIGFGLFLTETVNAYAKDIDMNSIVYSVCTGTVRWNDIQLVS
ncbi:MAG: ABC transporter substrate-binding protein [Oscillospiraceae bacterium]|nr:ABC transporter substrate-binding protein [Oscillospiraceae bacterium]